MVQLCLNLVFIAIIHVTNIKSLTDTQMLESLPPDSVDQQEYITAIQNEDGYNWG